MTKYLDLFVSESREHLGQLTAVVLSLEEHPADQDQVEALYRHAHSLKGMAAAMGYGTMSDLAHRMESLVDRVRKEFVPFAGGCAGLLLEGAAFLEAMTRDIERSGSADLDVTELMDRLDGYGGKERVARARMGPGNDRVVVLLVACGPVTVGVPVAAVIRYVEVSSELLDSGDSRLIVPVEGGELSLLDLSDLLGLHQRSRCTGLVPALVTEIRGRVVGLVADRIGGKQEVVVQPLDGPLATVRGLAGAATLDDGSSIYILDVNNLA